jgi:hypothetical protein
MKVNADWKKYAKKHQIEIGNLNDPYEIVDLFKTYSIEKYVYRIKYKGVVIKYGMSCPKSKSAISGDRVYRQIGHNCSWGNKRLTGSSGSDWRITEDDFEKMYNHKIDHLGMSVTVWDLTNYPFETTKPFNEVNAIENSLIEEYVELVGEKPIGNINDESGVKNRAGVQTKLVQALFSFG